MECLQQACTLAPEHLPAREALGTGLYLLGEHVQAQAVYRAWLARDPAAAERGIREVIDRLVVVRDTARAVSHQLHPAILRMGLPAALRSLRDSLEPAVAVEIDVAPDVEARELQRSFGVDEESAPVPLPADVRLVLYRLVQEAAQGAWDTGTPFRELLAERAPDLDLDAVLDYEAYLEHVPGLIARLDRLG